MRLEGTFTSPASTAELRAVLASPEALDNVATLRDVERVSPETMTMVYTPRLTMGPVPLATTVTTTSDSDELVELTVRGVRGTQAVDVTLAVSFAPAEFGTDVSWTAQVVVRGGVASVGQRVVGELARRAIGEVLSASASVAATGSVA